MDDPQTSPGYEATVVISTINRKDDLRRALRSTVMQKPPVEIIVIDDGSTDGTVEMVAQEFTQVRVFRSEKSLGLTVQRNNAAGYATTNIIVSIDDDAEFSSPDIVAQTVREFDQPLIGAVSIPFIDTWRNIKYGFNLPNQDDIFLDYVFIGTAYALRVDIFRDLHGFREFLWGWGEEDDYCLRLLNAGYFVRCGSAAHIYHHVSPSRNLSRIAYYSARNSILYSWLNVPMPHFLIHLAGTTVMNAVQGIKTGLMGATLKGLFRGYIDALTGPLKRSPVSVRAYRLSRRIRKGGVIELGLARELLWTGNEQQ